MITNGRIARAAAVAGMVALTAGSLCAEDWPQWRGPRRDGTSAERISAKAWQGGGPKTLWKASIGIGFAGVAVRGDLAVATGNAEGKDTVFAFDAKTGAPRWKHTYASPLAPLRHEGGPYVTPTFDGERICAIGKKGQMFCLRAADGKVLWQKDLIASSGSRLPNYGYAASPLVLADRLILNLGPAGAALDKATGKILWQSKGEAKPGHASPLEFGAGADKAVLILIEGKMMGIAPATGKVLWQQALPAWGRPYKITDPVLLGDRVYVTASYVGLCAMWQVGPGGVRQLWKTRGLVSKFLNGVRVGEHIVGSHMEKTFRCLDTATGEMTWEQPFAGSVLKTPDACLILTTDGQLVLAEVGPKKYKELARGRVLTGKCWTAPSLANGLLYCHNARGDLVCVDLRAK